LKVIYLDQCASLSLDLRAVKVRRRGRLFGLFGGDAAASLGRDERVALLPPELQRELHAPSVSLARVDTALEDARRRHPIRVHSEFLTGRLAAAAEFEFRSSCMSGRWHLQLRSDFRFRKTPGKPRREFFKAPSEPDHFANHSAAMSSRGFVSCPSRRAARLSLFDCFTFYD
jgi:hypothetical protein